ncbi:MAG: lysophospholipid acyltransferase family protein [Phycisphaerae bacterium]|nr:lysophospholipid acyltransferase family protein [Phycisphaerae bacterium]
MDPVAFFGPPSSSWGRVAGVSPNDLVSVLRQGRVLTGEVLQSMPGGRLLVGVGEHKVTASTSDELQPGNRYLFEIVDGEGSLHLRAFAGQAGDDGELFKTLRAALGARCDEARLRRIARRSFEHFAQVFLVELAMTPRLVNLWSWSRYVELCDLGPALRRLLEGRPTILVTAHFGNFELLGYAIARLGLPLNAVMRPLDNPLLNDFLLRSREVAGLHLLYKKGAASQFDDVLGGGGALAFIADQDAGRKGVFADFFGRQASWYKSIGLLAMRHNAAIVVGYAARTRPGFHYRIAIERTIEPAEWRDQPRPLEWITQAFAAGLERAIARWPEQYLWVHRRWKTRPKGEPRAPAVAQPASDGRPGATPGMPPSLGA